MKINDINKHTTDSPNSLSSLHDGDGVETGSVVELCPGRHLLLLAASQEGGGQLHGEAGLEPVDPGAPEDVPAVLENYLVLRRQLEPLSFGSQSPPPSLLLSHLPSLLQADQAGNQESFFVLVLVLVLARQEV